MNDLLRRRTTLAVAVLALSLVTAACAGSGASTEPSPSANPPASAPATEPPANAFEPPLEGEPRIIVPKPGQRDVRAISAESLHAAVDGRSVSIAIDWWSGVEPCSILDSIVIEAGDGTFAVTLREGRGPEDVACIAIAEQHRAFVDLGELEPGTYTVSDATGAAAPIEVIVP